MNFKELVTSRYSVRSFASVPVPAEKLQAVLEAARLAPTACNLQPQRIFVLQSTEALTKVRACTSCHFDAPVVLLVCYDKAESWERGFDGFNSGEMDASIVGTHLMLAATAQGLGSTWVCYFDPAKLRKEFALPENLVPAALFPLGVPASDSKPNPNHFNRKKLEETVSWL
jgi:nitroreductase